MSRQRNVDIAEENYKIVKKGYYRKNGQIIDLPQADYSRVIVIDPFQADEIEDKVIINTDDVDAEMYVVEADSFAVADGLERSLVMNFANAHTPGGGYLTGANAQEECLCRQSTLYCSISSEIATEMYQYNLEHHNPCYSDYMLLSPNVCIFRDIHGELLDEPYLTSVITVPAPNRNGAAKKVKQSIVDIIMKNRLSKMFAIATEYGYKSLVLGAWGCGAFGNNPHKVARYFYDCLIKYGYACNFDMIAFAIIGKNDRGNLLAFSDVFKNNAEICYDLEKLPVLLASHEPQVGFYQSKFPPVDFNFSKENISKENVGYAYGTTVTGHPFMAETWRYNNNQDVAFYLPVIDEFMDKEGEPLINEETNTEVLTTKAEVKGFHALCVGMINNGYVDDVSVMDAYITFLRECNLIRFESNKYNCYAFLLTDINGNDLIAITISLIFAGELEATTPISWTLFNKASHIQKPNLYVISSKK